MKTVSTIFVQLNFSSSQLSLGN